MTNRLRIYGIITLICMTASCSRVPKHILSERKLRVVLYDMLIGEAMIEIKIDSFQTNSDRQAVFDAIFSKHRITQAQYDSSLIWYGKHLDLYMNVYKLALKDVNENYAALGDMTPVALSGEISMQDSVDIWFFKRYDVFKPEIAFNTLTFDIIPSEPYSAGSAYHFMLSVWGIPADLKPKPVIHLNAVQADTIISVRKEIEGDGDYETTLSTLNDRQVLRIYGYVSLNAADPAFHRVYLNDIRLMKYK